MDAWRSGERAEKAEGEGNSVRRVRGKDREQKKEQENVSEQQQKRGTVNKGISALAAQ